MNYQRAWAEINHAHIAHNLRAVRGLLPERTKLMAVVKGDAYGHGIVPVAETLLANGANALGVAICEEGIVLREAGITAPILIMGFTPDPLLHETVKRDLVQTVFNPSGAEALAQAAKQAQTDWATFTGAKR